ncbi:cupin domain-containing protein [Streptomyces sp. DSM 40750]|uniref:cupin domain-containing protein n=1 Tax=Streptomyces sp. DSM 40750 TaxID=2801030 RepID=UPI00214C8E1B|nr:cupin domain-containing protein [Streptomyces sp. DSM 40750]UUU19119.1 cupin domain-containing protein [Streptomyces sp. DSM 40750]UUU27537.1 cupin domain-containing protein [Streptomyces sp. DSM 40750]
MAPQKYLSSPLVRREEGWPKGHVFVPPGEGSRPGVALIEWELRGESWTDEHPHDEFNYVLEGHLFVACDGETLEAVTGDVVRVPAGSVGRYWAPEYARMIAVYGPNPQGLESRVHAYTRLESSAERSSGSPS